MTVSIRIINLESRLNINKRYEVTGVFQILDGTNIIAEKTMSVSGFLLESGDIKKSVIDRFKPLINDWKINVKNELKFKSDIDGIITELEK